MSLAGCATGPIYQDYWKKDGISMDQARTAEASCQYDIGMARFADASERQQMLQACMMKDGYRWGTYTLTSPGN
ncbi:hypothetical protein ACKC9G_05440 [Pokkaliibacter sp. CJK22405]|uniref:hypothetical protein n=1 Tax=Pokkaliibacter sp. CJK22405 TaxID=3384615 RepID=UPI00398556DB